MLYTKEELFQFAQKEYELEFKTLNNTLQGQKQSLKNQNEILDLEIETIQNKLQGNITDEKRKELSQQIINLEKQKLANQEETFRLSEEEIDNQYNQLLETKKLWEDLGYDTRVLDKAFERLENIRLGSQGLAVDFSEVEKAASDLAKSFKKKYGKTLSEGTDLTADEKAFVAGQIDSFIEEFGGYLSEGEKKIIRENFMSNFIPSDTDAEDAKKRALDLASQINDALKQAADAYNQSSLENTKGRLSAELEAIKNRYKVEEQILKSQLDNQLITESQFRAKQKELRQKQLAEENSINQKIFEAEKRSELQSVAADTFAALASNAINNFEKYDALTAGIATTLGYVAIVAAGAAKADAIRRKKFFPVKFEEGGMVSGPSHAQGGVPFTVQGRGGYEMEGGEFIVNKKAASHHRGLLERINNSYKMPSSPSNYKFASGGTVMSKGDESVDYLKAIAEATTSTAIQSSKPVRAFVSSKDLRTSENERRIRDRNDRI